MNQGPVTLLMTLKYYIPNPICYSAEDTYLKFYIYYRPQLRSYGKVMFLHLSVILSGGGGGLLPKCTLGYTPGQTTLPPPRSLQRTVRILLECILVKISFIHFILRKKYRKFIITIYNNNRYNYISFTATTIRFF